MKNILSNSIGSLHSDRIEIITEASWSDFINLDVRGAKKSFRNGVVTIVSPGRNHEILADLIRSVIWAYCRQENLALFPYNSTTLKVENKEGKEPDVAYCINTDKEKPDLAIEINLTSGSVDDLTKYQYLKIPEVWLWENKKINFYSLEQNRYLNIKRSEVLNGLTCDGVTTIVNFCFGKNLFEVEKFFKF